MGWGNRALAAVLEAEPAADEEMGEEFSLEGSDGMVSPQGSGMYNPAAPHIIDVKGYTSGRQMRWAKACLLYTSQSILQASSTVVSVQFCSTAGRWTCRTLVIVTVIVAMNTGERLFRQSSMPKPCTA